MIATTDLDMRLKNARIKKRLSQSDVANKLNISRQAVSRWENGKSIPDADNLALLSQLYEVSLDELLNCASPNKTEGKHENENPVSDLSTSQNKPAPEPAPQAAAPHTPSRVFSSFNKEYGFLVLLLTFSCLSCWIGIIVSTYIFIWTWKNRRNYKLILVLAVVCFLSNLNNIAVIISLKFPLFSEYSINEISLE